ncbi:MAG: hypothetical protein V3T55_02545 [Anaerolineales bacterium]
MKQYDIVVIGPGLVGFSVGSCEGSTVGRGGTVKAPSKRVTSSIFQTILEINTSVVYSSSGETSEVARLRKS